MKKWILKPIDSNAAEWRRSTLKAEIKIPADSAGQARRIASMKFGIAVRQCFPGAEILGSPWLNSDVVSCERLSV